MGLLQFLKNAKKKVIAHVSNDEIKREQLDKYKSKGYKISYECLLDNRNIIEMIENKV